MGGVLFDRQSDVPSSYWRLCTNNSRENVAGHKKRQTKEGASLPGFDAV
jgi:hypothetical protein